MGVKRSAAQTSSKSAAESCTGTVRIMRFRFDPAEMVRGTFLQVAGATALAIPASIRAN